MNGLTAFKQFLSKRCDLGGPISTKVVSQWGQLIANMSTDKSNEPREEGNQTQIVLDKVRNRFRTADAKAYLTYTVRPNRSNSTTGDKKTADVLDLQHTFVPSSARGQGIASRLVVAAFEHAKENGLLVQPTCPYISGTFLSQHSEWNDLVVQYEKRSGL